MIERRVILESIPANLAAIGLAFTALTSYWVRIRPEFLNQHSRHLDGIAREDRRDFLRGEKLKANDDGVGPLKPPPGYLRVFIPTTVSKIGAKARDKQLFIPKEHLIISREQTNLIQKILLLIKPYKK